MPPQAGICLKSEHYRQAAEASLEASFFEVHAENYMGDGGPAHLWLDRARSRAPLSIHGVGLSIGSSMGLDDEHLDRLRRVVQRFEPAMVSEHLAWCSHGGTFYNDLLPLPYNSETLTTVCAHVDQVQSALGREILVENPSTYLAFRHSEIPEAEFLGEVSNRTGCGLLLDVNNVYVSATNQRFSAETYLDRFPLHRVQEIHLAGHAAECDEDGSPLLIDTHDREVCEAVWRLYQQTVMRTGPLPTLIEWDAHIPEWTVLNQQAILANGILQHTQEKPHHAVAV